MNTALMPFNVRIDDHDYSVLATSKAQAYAHAVVAHRRRINDTNPSHTFLSQAIAAVR